MGYIYQADTYCDDCGDNIRGKLHAQGLAPEDIMDHSSYDSDDFPKDADVEYEEADAPQHCAQCHKFLRNPLTSDGYSYVQEKLNESGITGLGELHESNAVLEDWGGWYGFRYWDAEDCAEDCDDYFQDERKRTPGWYSDEAF
jgi:hypothetical protein